MEHGDTVPQETSLVEMLADWNDPSLVFECEGCPFCEKPKPGYLGGMDPMMLEVAQQLLSNSNGRS